MEAIERGLRVMDSTALSLCMDNDLPIHVFNMADERNIDRIVSGERVGTIVSSASMSEERGVPSSPTNSSSTPRSGWPSRSRRAGTSSPRCAPAAPRRTCSTGSIVDYYGVETPIKQLAQVAATDARLLTLTPFDKNSIGAIEKAILESDLGLTPSNDGNVIRLQIPELNEERRRELVRVVHGVAEEGKVAVRNIRRDVMHDLRELKKEGEVGEDDERRAEAELQKRTDESTKEIDGLLKAKEEEILEV